MPLPRPIKRLFASLSCLVGLLTAFSPAEVRADQPAPSTDPSTPADAGDDSDYPGFSGAFTGVTIRGGLPVTRLKGATEGWSADVGLRHSFPIYVGDMRAAYHFEHFDDSNDRRLQRHGLSLHAAFHPGFYFMAGSDWFPYVIASIYADIGLEAAIYTGDVNGFGVVPSVSTGVDLPLGDPDARPIPWLHISWRRYLGSTHGNSAVPAPYSSVQIGLAWRINRTLL